MPDDELSRALLALGLGAARTVPITWLAPAFGGQHVPAPIRVGFGLSLAVLGYPALAGPAARALDGAGPLLLVLLVVREILVGLTVGLVVACFFRAAEAAGRIADTLRGATMAEVLSPDGEQRTSPLGNLAMLLAVVLFFEIGGARHLLLALGRSYEAVPFAPLGAGGGAGMTAAGDFIATVTARLVEAAVGLAAPVIVAFLLGEVALGVIARAAPQVPMHFIAMPAKALLGVGLVLVGMGSLHAALVRDMGGWAALWQHAFDLWR